MHMCMCVCVNPCCMQNKVSHSTFSQLIITETKNVHKMEDNRKQKIKSISLQVYGIFFFFVYSFLSAHSHSHRSTHKFWYDWWQSCPKLFSNSVCVLMEFLYWLSFEAVQNHQMAWQNLTNSFCKINNTRKWARDLWQEVNKWSCNKSKIKKSWSCVFTCKIFSINVLFWKSYSTQKWIWPTFSVGSALSMYMSIIDVLRF